MNRKLRVRQRDHTDCGAACIASVCRYYKHYVPVSRIRQLAGTDSDGTTIAGIIRAAEKSGMHAKGVRASFESIQDIPLPVIAHVIIENRLNHFVVLAKARKRSVTLMDPVGGVFIKMKHKEFQKIWSGVLVLLEPSNDFAPTKGLSIVHRFWQLAYPLKNTLSLALIGAIVISIAGLLPSIYIQKIVDEILPSANKGMLNMLSLIMIAVLVFQTFIGIARNILNAIAGKSIIINLTVHYYKHLLQLPQRFFDTMRTGEIISRINDVVKISSFINDIAIGIILNILILVFSMILLFLYHWKLAAIVLLTIPLYGILFFINDTLNKTWQRKLMMAEAEMNTQMVNSFRSATTVKKLGIENHVFGRLHYTFMGLMVKMYKTIVYHGYIHYSTDFFSKLFTIIIIWAGSYFVIENKLSTGRLLSFYSVMGYFTVPVMYLLTANKSVREAVIAADRLFEIIDLEKESSGKMYIDKNIVENIKCMNVSFRYPNKNDLFKNINLEITRGEIIGISGGNGCGKSTFAALLQHIYETSGGQIMINGVHIKYIDNRSLRSSILTVSQHTQLFAESILENIAIGVMEPDYALLFDIAERVGVTEFVEQLPGGFNTIVTEQGSNLSGGQKQKIAIARALYRQPSVLILDEATSAIDLVSEEKIMQTFAWYRGKGNTIIIIAHRPSAMKICDRIIYIENGCVKNDI